MTTKTPHFLLHFRRIPSQENVGLSVCACAIVNGNCSAPLWTHFDITFLTALSYKTTIAESTLSVSTSWIIAQLERVGVNWLHSS